MMFQRVDDMVLAFDENGQCWLAPDNDGYPHAEAEVWVEANPPVDEPRVVLVDELLVALAARVEVLEAAAARAGWLP